MKSFRDGYLERMAIPHSVLQSVRAIGEFKGRQDLHSTQMPELMDSLREAAVIQSTESSNRIEGVVASRERIEAIVAERTEPRNRPEQEIAGYRDALRTIHTRWDDLRPSSTLVRDVHRELFRYTGRPAGNWKSTDNSIAEIRPDGTRVVRFQPVAAHRVEFYMTALHEELAARWDASDVDRLILIAAYVLDFLCIHPFSDGNGRVGRLMTLLLLYRAGYSVGRYVSLERVIEQSRESYYESLHQSSAGWHEGKHDLMPWLGYLLGTVIAAYRELDERVATLSGARGAKTRMVEDAIARLPSTFRIVEVERLCPGVSRETIRLVFNRLRQAGELERQGAGLGATWVKRSSES